MLGVLIGGSVFFFHWNVRLVFLFSHLGLGLDKAPSKPVRAKRNNCCVFHRRLPTSFHLGRAGNRKQQTLKLFTSGVPLLPLNRSHVKWQHCSACRFGSAHVSTPTDVLSSCFWGVDSVHIRAFVFRGGGTKLVPEIVVAGEIIPGACILYFALAFAVALAVAVALTSSSPCLYSCLCCLHI